MALDRVEAQAVNVVLSELAELAAFLDGDENAERRDRLRDAGLTLAEAAAERLNGEGLTGERFLRAFNNAIGPEAGTHVGEVYVHGRLRRSTARGGHRCDEARARQIVIAWLRELGPSRR